MFFHLFIIVNNVKPMQKKAEEKEYATPMQLIKIAKARHLVGVIIL